MTIGPAEWTIAGIVVLVLSGLGFLFWAVRSVMGRQRGRTIYVLPDTHPDHDDHDDEHDGMEALMLRRTVRWRSLEHGGLEHLDIEETRGGYSVHSVVAGAFEGFEYGARYELLLAPDWSFRALDLELTDGRALHLRADGRGDWTDGGGTPLPALRGCIDIDISATPFTNTLPIRRLNLATGATQHLRVAWVPMDTLAPVVDEQIYTRLGDTHWRYAAADGSFEATIAVDADGLVVDYPPLFARI